MAVPCLTRSGLYVCPLPYHAALRGFSFHGSVSKLMACLRALASTAASAR